MKKKQDIPVPEDGKPVLPKDFFKQFKSKEEFRSFFDDLFKRGVEEMLQAELDEHLGYEKYAKEGHNSGNSRNGSYPKKVKTESVGDMVLNIPRDRNAEFSPQLIPKGQRMSDKLPSPTSLRSGKVPSCGTRRLSVAFSNLHNQRASAA